jgi:hypothetical protein
MYICVCRDVDRFTAAAGAVSLRKQQPQHLQLISCLPYGHTSHVQGQCCTATIVLPSNPFSLDVPQSQNKSHIGAQPSQPAFSRRGDEVFPSFSRQHPLRHLAVSLGPKTSSPGEVSEISLSDPCLPCHFKLFLLADCLPMHPAMNQHWGVHEGIRGRVVWRSAFNF